MYSIKDVGKHKLRRKIVTISFALVLLAEFGEFFVPKNDPSTHDIRLEMPDHLPDESKGNHVQKKPKSPISQIHTKQAN